MERGLSGGEVPAREELDQFLDDPESTRAVNKCSEKVMPDNVVEPCESKRPKFGPEIVLSASRQAASDRAETLESSNKSRRILLVSSLDDFIGYVGTPLLRSHEHCEKELHRYRVTT